MIGNRLKQARLLAGLTQEELASQLDEHGFSVTKQAISKYEKNKSIPPAQLLLLATQILDVPSTYFTHEPNKKVTWLAFRRHSQLAQKEQEMVKSYAADIAELQLELIDVLFPNREYTLSPRRAVSTFDQAEETALELRQIWSLDHHPVDSLIQTVENHQIIVVGWSKNKRKFDGLAGWCDDHPVIVINTEVTADRRRFSVAHELGHILMDTAALSSQEEEQLAHRFAAAFIVPADIATYELGQRRTQLDLSELAMLKRKYGLSIAAWVYRAKDLGIISPHHAQQLQIEISRRDWRKIEPVQYIGDEMPIQLIQMAKRAVAEGLISPDRVKRVCLSCLEDDWQAEETEYPSSLELIAMSEEERQIWIDRMINLAENEDFEIFEAYGEEEF